MNINQLSYPPATTATQANKTAWLSARPVSWRILLYGLLGIGLGLRLFHYLNNRSLWTDEIYLAVSLIRMNFAELSAPMLAYEQKAPIGFLWLVRLSVLGLGKSEMALRLVPLLSGIGALFLFVPVARYFLKPWGALLAVGIMALAPPLVYHAVEIKQYSMELLATVGALYLYKRYQPKNNTKAFLVWSLGGAVLIWFSYAVVFILAGMAGGLGFYHLTRKNWPGFGRAVALGFCWLLSFLINYRLFTNKYAHSEWLVIWFQHEAGFMPLPPASLQDLKWFGRAFYKLFVYPMGLAWEAPFFKNQALQLLLKAPILPVLFFLTGLGAIFRQKQKLFWVLLLPVVLTLLASGLKIYPFYERLLVFLAPPLILFIAAGTDYLLRRLPFSTAIKAVLIILVLAVPIFSSAAQVINPDLFGGYKKAYHRETLLYINEHYQPGDVVYVYWNVRHTYQFYKDTYKLKFKAISGKDVRYQSANTQEYFRNLEPDFKALDGKKRVWVIYNKFYVINIGDLVGTPAYYYADLIDGRKLQAKLLTLGKEVDTYNTLDVKVSLFDFSGK